MLELKMKFSVCLPGAMPCAVQEKVQNQFVLISFGTDINMQINSYAQFIFPSGDKANNVC
jgi:hypothetical protein